VRSTGVFLGLVLLTAVSPARAASPPPPAYARFCSLMSGRDQASRSYQVAVARRPPGRSDAEVLSIVRTALPAHRGLVDDPQTLRVVVRSFRTAHAAPDFAGEHVLLAGGAPNAPVWLVAAIADDGTVSSLDRADEHDVHAAIGGMRFMAAYALLNDLLASDASVPRAGCEALTRAWFWNGVAEVPVLERDFATPPTPDPARLRVADEAWRAYVGGVGSQSEAERAITLTTLATLGARPPLTFVYRDAGSPESGLGEIDVARIGNAHHAYAIVLTGGDGATKIVTAPLCVSGDTRCARYYTWP